MGVWGTSLYANDFSSDVRDSYMKFLQEQFGDEEAYCKTIEKFYECFNDEFEPLLWYALADTQWKLGRLLPEVKDKAIYWIDLRGGINLWAENRAGGFGWEKTLEKLKMRLLLPMPSKKQMKKLVEFAHNPWNIGDIYAYRFHSEYAKRFGLFGKYISFQKIGDDDFDGILCSRLQIYDKVFDKVPTVSDLDGIRILPLDWADVTYEELNFNAYLIRYKSRDYMEKNFTFICNKPDCMLLPLGRNKWYWWKDLETEFLCDYFQAWRNYDYTITECEGPDSKKRCKCRITVKSDC